MKTAEAIIIGAGIIGTSIAYFLAQMGMRNILVLEKGTVASGTTGASSGLVRMHYTNPLDSLLALKSFELFKDWENRIGGQCGFRQTGFLKLVGPNDIENLKANIKMLKGLGVKTDILFSEDVRALQPFLNVEDVGAAAFEPESGYADGYLTTHSLKEAAQRNEVIFKQGIGVHSIRVESAGVAGVSLDCGDEIDAPVVVISAGVSSKYLASTAGVEIPLKIRSMFAGILERPASIRNHMTVVDKIMDTYFRPEGSNLTVIDIQGARSDEHEAENAEDAPKYLSHDSLTLSINKVCHRIPEMVNAKLRNIWSVTEGFTPDRHCILDGANSASGLYLATGFSGTGFKIGPAVGMCMAELITKGKAETVEIGAFGLSRFKEDKPLFGNHEYNVGVVRAVNKTWWEERAPALSESKISC